MKDVTEIRFVGSREQRSIAESCRGAIVSWCDQWLPEGVQSLPKEPELLGRQQAETWMAASSHVARRQTTGDWCGLRIKSSDYPAFLALLTGGAPQHNRLEGTIGKYLGDKALASFAEAVLGGPVELDDRRQGSNEERKVEYANTPGSHSVFGGVEVNGLSIEFVVTLRAFDNELSHRKNSNAPLENVEALVRNVVAERSVGIQVRMRSAEIGIADLMTLEVGDVLRLDHALSEGVSVEMDDGTRIGTGELGKQGLRKAIRIS